MDTLVSPQGHKAWVTRHGVSARHVAARAHGGRDGRRRRPRLVGDPQEGQQGVEGKE